MIEMHACIHCLFTISFKFMISKVHVDATKLTLIIFFFYSFYIKLNFKSLANDAHLRLRNYVEKLAAIKNHDKKISCR